LDVTCCGTTVHLDGAVASDHRPFSASVRIKLKIEDDGPAQE